MARPLWHIPDPVEAQRLAEIRRDELLAKREAERKEREVRAAGRRREKGLIAQRLTDQRIREAREWRATHEPPTPEQLQALAELFPNLAGVLTKGRK
jgi:hypothetical protein